MRSLGVLSLVVGLAAVLGACSGPCGDPCASPPRPCPVPCERPSACATRCNPCNPCGPSAPSAPRPYAAELVCEPDSKPCACWPAYGPSGSLTAHQLLNEIIAECDWHLQDPTCLHHRPSWRTLRGQATYAKTHGSSCTKYTCQEYWNVVNTCHTAVMSLSGACAPAPFCSELNHADPVVGYAR